MKRIAFALSLFAFLVSCTQVSDPVIKGELKKWHRISLLFEGPESAEKDSINPFLFYRLNVVFTYRDKHYSVPGFYAADGDAAISSAVAGNKWQVNFTPDEIGSWTYKVSFRKGENIAVSLDEEAGESAGFMDGYAGSFEVIKSDKLYPDFRSRGRLVYTGDHYLQFSETGEYFLKVGADSPENLLAFTDFDNTPNYRNYRKSWAPHAKDFDPMARSYLWGTDQLKGHNLLGALSYLAGKGLNAFSFLTFNVDGDDRNVFPHLLKCDLESYSNYSKNDAWENLVEHQRFDISKMAQWDQAFSWGESLGIFLHFKTQETENDHKMDGGALGIERMLYYRELIARFGYHLGLNWNLGEENTQSTQQQQAMAEYIHRLDPYNHPIVLHTYPDQHEKTYAPLIGDQSALSGLSIQTDQRDFSKVYAAVDKWVTASAKAGKKWLVSCDEPGDHEYALVPDQIDPNHNAARINGLWGAFMAGGMGTEWYFGYNYDNSDLTCQDWHSRELFWDQAANALNFFKKFNIPVWNMKQNNTIINGDNWVLTGPNDSGKEFILIYLKGSNEFELSLPDGKYHYGFFNPRTGEGIKELLHFGDFTSSGPLTWGAPDNNDWVLLVTRTE